MSKQILSPGGLHEPLQRELQHYVQERVVQRLWAKDASLWPKESIDSNPALAKMDWVSLHGTIPQFLEFLEGSFRSADADGFTDHALLSSESLNLSSRAFLQLPDVAPQRKLVIFDSLAPELIQKNEEELDLRRTLFVVSNKARYHLRDHCLFLYFREKLHALVGNEASQQFVAETEPGTYLASISRSYAFREMRPDVTAIPAAFCSLTQFVGLLMATGTAPRKQISASVRQIQAVCSTADVAENSALQLAAFLSSSIRAGRPYLAFVVPSALIAYARRLAQTVGGGLARGTTGVIPIIWPLPSSTSGLRGHANFAVLSYRDDECDQVKKCIEELRANNEPFAHIRTEQSADLLTETFKWEAATILGASRIGVDPFEIVQSHVPRALANEMLDSLEHGGNPLQRSSRLTNSFMQLYADGATRSEISTLNLNEALRSFLRIATPARHLSLIIDIPRTEALHDKFAVLRDLLSSTLRRPVLMAFGPYAVEYAEHFFRHSLPYGPCMLFTTDSWIDKVIPGAHYTFGQFHQVLSLSEYDTLVHWRRPVIRLHLVPDFPAVLDQLLQAFEQALHRFQA